MEIKNMDEYNPDYHKDGTLVWKKIGEKTGKKGIRKQKKFNQIDISKIVIPEDMIIDEEVLDASRQQYEQSHKGCVSGLTIIVEALDKVQNSIGTIGMIGAGAGIIGFIKNFGKLKELGFVTQAANQITNFVQQAQSMSTAASGFQALGQSLTGFSTSTIMAASNMAGLTAAETAATLAGTGMKVEMIASTLAMTGLSEAELAAALTTAGLCTAEEATTIATTALAGAEGTATGATLGFAASLKAAATGLATFLLTNPVGWAIMAAGAIFGVVKIVDALTESFDEACEKADNARQTLKNAEQDVESVRSSQANLRTEIESLADKYEVEFTDEDSIQDIISKLKELNLATADAQTL